MKIDFDSIKPIYLQVASAIEDDIILCRLAEGEPVYSQLLLSKELGINPATAAKGISLLVTKGILEKQRGLAMSVCSGARQQLLDERRHSDFTAKTAKLIEEAKKLSLSKKEVIKLINEIYDK